MFRKLIVFALMLAVLFSAAVQPSYAQDRDQGETEIVTLENVAKSIRELPVDMPPSAGDYIRTRMVQRPQRATPPASNAPTLSAGTAPTRPTKT